MTSDLETRLREALAMVQQKSEQYVAERKECDRLRAETAALKALLAEAREALKPILTPPRMINTGGGLKTYHITLTDDEYRRAAEVLRKMEQENG